MKSQNLIAMSIARPASCVHVSRDEWSLEIVREPRESCIPKWKWRNDLRDMHPGTRTTINGVDIYRKNLAHQASRYMIGGVWLDVTAAIAAIEAGKPQAQPMGELRLELNLGEAI